MKVSEKYDIIIQEFEFEIVSRIGDGEILFEDFEQAFVQTVVGVGLNLEEIPEGLNLNIEEVRVFKLSDRREIDYCGFFFCQGTINYIVFYNLIAGEARVPIQGTSGDGIEFHSNKE